MKITLSKHNDAVFIIGCPRTGSKIYMNMLNGHSPINISPEMHFLSPWWLRKDFVRTVKQKLGDLDDNERLERLVNLMGKHIFQGSFWKHFNLDTENLFRQFAHSDRSFREILRILLVEHARSKGKDRIGAKFPTHFSYAELLKKWFPGCKLLHIIRDPRAIYASQYLKKRKQKTLELTHVMFRFITLIHINVQFRWAVNLHRNFRTSSNYYLSRYEDLVLNPQKYVPLICNFLEIDYDHKMLEPPVQDSSYGIYKKKGMDKSAIDRWQHILSPFELHLVNLLNSGAMKKMGYFSKFPYTKNDIKIEGKHLF